MTLTGSTPHRTQGLPRRTGVVSGFALKLIRESIDMTQADLAEQLHVDLATVQGWESGRRPLTAVRTFDLARIRARLIGLGVSPDTFTVVRDAIDADVVITEILASDGRPRGVDHPLSMVVHRRDISNLVTWPFTGEAPDRLRSLPARSGHRRGPSTDRPILLKSEADQFFDQLLFSADQARDSTQHLLRRQSIYLLGFDRRASTRQWLVDEQRAAMRSIRQDESVESWIAVRSSAVALAHGGDIEALHRFVQDGLAQQQHEVANLNYWAYWVGEIGRLQPDDRFLCNASGGWWAGVALCAHLLDRLTADAQHLPLNARSLWSLMLARPRMLDDHPGLRRSATQKLDTLLDLPDLPVVTRQELVSVSYAVRLAGR